MGNSHCGKFEETLMNEQAIDNRNSAKAIIFVTLLLAIGYTVLRDIGLPSARDQEIHWSTLTLPASYIIGSVASFWMVEHVVDFRA